MTTVVPYCVCRHARQIHTPTDGALCRGLCHRYGHTDTDHAGPCTANRCLCGRFTPQP